MLNDIISCAEMAGEAALSFFRASSSVLHADTKFNESDIVTEADRASEQVIKNYIGEKYPSHAILSEESGANDKDSDWRWVIDPVDGTTNFYSGLPFWAVSIGVQYRGKTKYGVVYAPALRELFAAESGKGATLNGNPIMASSESELARSVVSTGFPVDKNINPDCNADNFLAVLPRVRGMRRLGSSAMDICYTAAGFLDAYWELGLHEWDICAASLIAEEAGCKVGKIRADKPHSILVAPEQLYQKVVTLLSPTPCVRLPQSRLFHLN